MMRQFYMSDNFPQNQVRSTRLHCVHLFHQYNYILNCFHMPFFSHSSDEIVDHTGSTLTLNVPSQHL